MSTYKTATVILRFSVLTTILLLAIGCYSECNKSRAESDCSAHGYPRANATWGGLGTVYCVKRVNQTDVVVPLSSLK